MGLAILAAKIKPDKFQAWLSSLLAKVLKDPKALNKSENNIGFTLINLGIATFEQNGSEGEKQFAEELKKFIQEKVNELLAKQEIDI